jgi:hypothetical protein
MAGLQEQTEGERRGLRITRRKSMKNEKCKMKNAKVQTARQVAAAGALDPIPFAFCILHSSFCIDGLALRNEMAESEDRDYFSGA